jgi:hypothetical protein
MMLILPPLNAVFHVMVASKSKVHVKVMMLSIWDKINSCLRSDWSNIFRLRVCPDH